MRHYAGVHDQLLAVGAHLCLWGLSNPGVETAPDLACKVRVQTRWICVLLMGQHVCGCLLACLRLAPMGWPACLSCDVAGVCIPWAMWLCGELSCISSLCCVLCAGTSATLVICVCGPLEHV